ncbi:V-type immunoglobulin domain-containing suppressor of T-cell activation isoform X3 [Labrus mixtus]|uniref:V-type immunoglobulin domain-containing suppressor of T-cell activation isoform X3 n=1 Tax=Labrus mixtus TaxID=508554 RepID=UPI0029C07817|nr:V-type immunoglobulin domain-containing suppressor of T-cell activation isoform X3 [Labrus mixtus]
MERRSACQTHLRANRTALWFCLVLLFSAGAGGVKSHPSSTLSVSTPHLFYTCPEGATAKLVCGQSGVALHQTDVLKRSWLFTPHADQHCSGREGPRHTVVGGHSHSNHSLTPGLHFGSSEQNFWMVLQNVTLADQGRYCCLLLDFQVEHKHAAIVQKPHSHMILHVSPRKFSGVLISRCCHVQVLSCPAVVMSRCCHVQVLSCPGVVMSRCYNVQVLSCPGVIMSRCCHVQVLSCPAVVMSRCCHVQVLSCPGVVMSRCCHVQVLSYCPDS